MFNDDGEAGIGGGATGSITPVSGLQHNSTMEEMFKDAEGKKNYYQQLINQ